MKERIIRMGLTDLEKLLREQGTIKKNEHLNDAHIEPSELVIRVLAEDKPKGTPFVKPQGNSLTNLEVIGLTFYVAVNTLAKRLSNRA